MRHTIELIDASDCWRRMPCWKRYHLRREHGRQIGMVHRKFKSGLLDMYDDEII